MKVFKVFIKPFEALQRSLKIKLELNFFSSSGIGTGRVKWNLIIARTMVRLFSSINSNS